MVTPSFHVFEADFPGMKKDDIKVEVRETPSIQKSQLKEAILRPLHALQHLLGREKRILAKISRHTPLEILSYFKAVQNVQIVLPCGDVIEEGVLLKWKAEFRRCLESCIMLGNNCVITFRGYH
ncbi:hypothetical protein R1flu_001683 [Riccia fluitans]|uniref:Uncharacterized protein n=1 Tax=Riccia fluitans TaxID=41844 RepID=A0ABD1Y3Y3_9MARC